MGSAGVLIRDAVLSLVGADESKSGAVSERKGPAAFSGDVTFSSLIYQTAEPKLVKHNPEELVFLPPFLVH